jgi:serine/threonine protein kinase
MDPLRQSPEHGSDPPEALDARSTEGLPRQFGRYTLIRKRATGGMAELFVALQKSQGFEKVVVVKRILPALSALGDRAALAGMLMHEARVMAALSHSNVAQIFDAGSVDGAPFIAMEHVHGEDVRSIVRQMKKRAVVEFPIEHALSIVLGVCAGLAHTHDRRGLDGAPLGIVHRDISPQNVLVTFAGEVKIVDFGIAISSAMPDEEPAAGRPKGKLPYMSPEQARGEPIDGRSDVFSAGIMLFELTTGRRLFKAPSDRETLDLLLARDYPRPSDVMAGYPPELEAVVVRALAKDRDERWANAREMQAALEEFIRIERVPVSAVALSHLMRSLFEAELAAEEAALASSKPLADALAADAF